MSEPLTLLGGGCTGPLLGLLLARRGHAVRIFERRPDARRVALPAGRSINLALAARGIAALERAGLMPMLQPLLVPMAGRRVHEVGEPSRFLPYGQQSHELLWSVGRSALNQALTRAAEAAGVEFHFEHACRGADFDRGTVAIEDLARSRLLEVAMRPLIAADGAGSALRQAMAAARLTRTHEEPLAHGYKELEIPAGPGGEYLLEADALHIWPRGGYMLIALPNCDGTFTATLFLPRHGTTTSFEALATPGAARALFAAEFSDVLALILDFDRQYAGNPVGPLATIRTAPWHVGGQALLIGDAAHAIVPFHGQGLNCAFEDCVVLDDLLALGLDWASCFARFDAARQGDTAAIGRMALENYLEMRDTVREPSFALHKELSLALERRHPGRFVPRYSMVMFHAEIPYGEAERRGAIQATLLDEATAGIGALTEVDWLRLDEAIRARLPMLRPGDAVASGS